MPGQKEEKKEDGINLNAADREVLDFAAKEEAEADRILAEALGQEPEKKEENEGGPPKEDEKKAEKKEEKKEEKEPEKKAEQEEGKGLKSDGEVDISKLSNDELKEHLTVDNAKKRISAAQTRMHTANESIAKLQKDNDQLRLLIDQKATEPDPEKAPAQKAPDDTTPEASATDGEVDKSLEELKQEYPEIAAPMIKMMAKQQAENTALLAKIDTINKRDEDRDATAQEQTKKSHYDAISDVHPDYAEIADEPLFDDWINGLTGIEKAGAEAVRTNGATADVIDLLTRYKKDNGYELPNQEPEKKKEPEKVDSKLEKAKKLSTPSFKKAKDVNMKDSNIKFTREEIANMSEAEFAEKEEEIDKALAEHAVA